jgi:large subunit ribosomal protein L35
MKTKSALKGRVKVTGRGKLMRFKAGRRHLLARKNAKMRRQARRPRLIEGGIAKNYMELLKPSL